MATSKKKTGGAVTTIEPPATTDVDTVQPVAADVATVDAIQSDPLVIEGEESTDEATTTAVQVQTLDEDEASNFIQLGRKLEDLDVLHDSVWWSIGDAMVAAFNNHPGPANEKWVRAEIDKHLGQYCSSVGSKSAQLSQARWTAERIPPALRMRFDPTPEQVAAGELGSPMASYSAYVKVQAELGKLSEEDRSERLTAIRAKVIADKIPHLSVAKLKELALPAPAPTETQPDATESAPAGNAPTNAEEVTTSAEVAAAALESLPALVAAVNGVTDIPNASRMIGGLVHAIAVADGEIDDLSEITLRGAFVQLASVLGVELSNLPWS